MLEPTRPFGAPVRAYVSPLITFDLARERWQERSYWQLRREIFCEELRLFERSECDDHDAAALPIVAIAHSAGTPDAVVGVVRVYATDRGTWYGGRLGVAAGYRVRPQVGTGLIACAIRSAVAHGCRRFLANVLESNAGYFQRHHFRALERLEVYGRPHLLMEAELTAYAAAPGSRRAA